MKVATLVASRRPLLVTDSHAYLHTAIFPRGTAGLARVDWKLLQARDFNHSNDAPGRFDRYPAEALVHRHVPVDCLAGIVTHDEAQRGRIEDELHRRRLLVKPVADAGFQFP